MTCPKKFEFTLPTLCLTSLPSRIFKSSVFSCNSFAVGKAIRRFDTTAPLLTSISRKPWYETIPCCARSWQTMSRSSMRPSAEHVSEIQAAKKPITLLPLTSGRVLGMKDEELRLISPTWHEGARIFE